VVGVNVLNEFTDLPRVSLQTTHDSFKVFDVNFTLLFSVEEVEDLFEVVDFVIGKLLVLVGVLYGHLGFGYLLCG
jgi:hypothetical protein